MECDAVRHSFPRLADGYDEPEVTLHLRGCLECWNRWVNTIDNRWSRWMLKSVPVHTVAPEVPVLSAADFAELERDIDALLPCPQAAGSARGIRISDRPESATLAMRYLPNVTGRLETDGTQHPTALSSDCTQVGTVPQVIRESQVTAPKASRRPECFQVCITSVDSQLDGKKVILARHDMPAGQASFRRLAHGGVSAIVELGRHHWGQSVANVHSVIELFDAWWTDV